MVEDEEQDGEGAAAGMPLASSSPAPVSLLNKRPVRIFKRPVRIYFKRPVRVLVLYSMHNISYPVRVLVLYSMHIINNHYYVCRVPRACTRSWAPTLTKASCR